MAFHKVEAKEASSLWPEVYDPETKIGIEYTTRDMPKNPAQMRVFVRKNKRLILGFDVAQSKIKDERTLNYTFTYTGSLAKIRQAFRHERQAFPEFSSEDAFLSYLLDGTQALFSDEQLAASGVQFVVRLT